MVQDVLPTTAQRYDGAVAEFEQDLRVRDIPGLEELLNHSLHQLGHLCVSISSNLLPRARGGGATDHRLRCRDLPL